MRRILHVDMDAFFVSVELRRRPDLVGQPVVVGGTGRRGVVAAASYEARRFGVHSALPSAIARQRCPHAVFLSGDHALYASVGEQVREIFGRYTPLVEPLSLDEAFLDVSGAQNLFGPAPEIAKQIREVVRAETDLTCSVGVAPNKFLAKMASVEAKPVARREGIEPGAGIVVIELGGEREFLDLLPVERLWGVGPATLEKLHRVGVRRVVDLDVVDAAILASVLGGVQARHLLALGSGVDDRPVETDREAKSIGHEETYSVDKYSYGELRSELVRLADAVAARLRSAGLGARTLTLKLRFAGFHTITRSTTPGEAIDQAETIIGLLSPILESIDPTPGVRLLGVSGSNLGPVNHQLTLDEAIDRVPRYGVTETTMDQIRDRFGSDAIGRASAVSADGVRTVKKGQQQWGPEA